MVPNASRSRSHGLLRGNAARATRTVYWGTPLTGARRHRLLLVVEGGVVDPYKRRAGVTNSPAVSRRDSTPQSPVGASPEPPKAATRSLHAIPLSYLRDRAQLGRTISYG